MSLKRRERKQMPRIYVCRTPGQRLKTNIIVCGSLLQSSIVDTVALRFQCVLERKYHRRTLLGSRHREKSLMCERHRHGRTWAPMGEWNDPPPEAACRMREYNKGLAALRSLHNVREHPHRSRLHIRL